MWDIFINDYLLINFKDYIDPGIDFPINIFLLSIAVGLCIASVLITIHRRYTATLIKQLMRHNAIDEASAKSLKELRIEPTFFIRAALNRKSGQLANLIKCAGAKTYTYEEYSKLQKTKGFRDEKINFDEAKFYINAEQMPRARRINDMGLPSYFQTILGCLLILIIFISVTLFMPEILTLLT